MADLICANTTFAEVKSKLAAAQTNDRVLIPAGTVTFTHGLSSVAGDADLTLQNKAITIEGGFGGGETIFEDSRTQSALFPQRPQMIYWSTVDTGLTCFKKITVRGSTLTTDTNGNSVGTVGSITFLGNTSQLRITQCKLYPQKQPVMTLEGNCRGVMDNCQEYESLHSNGTVAMYVHHGSWGGVGGFGDNSWAQPHTMGTSNAFFIEDCDFVNNLEFGTFRAMLDGWKGSRTVVRYNRMTNINIANHGTESSGRLRSARQHEWYENTFTWTGGASTSCIGSRGGTGVCFNNAVTFVSGTLSRVFDLAYQRIQTPFMPYGKAGIRTPSSITRSGSQATITLAGHGYALGPSPGWPYATQAIYIRLQNVIPSGFNGNWRVLSVPTTDTLVVQLASDPGSNATSVGQFMSPWDANTDQYGYRCLDQCGAGQGDLMQNVDWPAPTTPDGHLHQSSEPVYAWNNTINGVNSPVVINGAAVVPMTVLNRDYFNSPMPGYTPYQFPHPLNDISAGSGADTTPPAAPTGVTIS